MKIVNMRYFCVLALFVLNSGGHVSAGIVIEENVAVPMRDGVILRADIFRPDDQGIYPVLVMRTPYGKHSFNVSRFAEAGYIVVRQDVRGRYASDGEWESFVRFQTHDAEDGYDTVEWAAKLPGANGKVGTFGASYNAFLQWKLAALRPPSLVAMAAFSIPARYTDLEGPGTIRPGRRLHWWMVTMTPDQRRRSGAAGIITTTQAREQWNHESTKWLLFTPYLDLPKEVFEGETEAVRYWLQNPSSDPWKLDERIRDIAVPNLNVVGWADHCHGNLAMDVAIRSEAESIVARTGSRTVIGPWGHAGAGQSRNGDFDFGPEASLDLVDLQIRWFDQWLKGEQDHLPQRDSFRIFVMGENRWRDEPKWPLNRAQVKSWYADSQGHANRPQGDGQLSESLPLADQTDRFVYDPHNPVPSLHGPSLFQVFTDQRPLESREDLLVYQTPPLTERIEVTGSPEVELYASSTSQDTDFFARLIDVSPDGVARDVSLGMVRARYRSGLQSGELITPGAIVKYQIRMSPTSNAFLPGHRIRLDITSSDFPNYDRNHNTGADQNADGHLISATQTIHHGPHYQTRVVLPVIPN